MIDNYAQIRELLSFPTANSFYFLEIIKRRKENPEMPNHAQLIRDFYIYSFKEYDDLEGKVKQVCNENNARAYFRLNVRDAMKIALQHNKRIAELILTGDYKAIPKSYASVVGEFHNEIDKTWVIDCDREVGKEEEFDKIVIEVRNFINDISTHNQPIKAELFTPNGLHIVARPFRLDVFREKFPHVESHKDNPVILYVA